MANRYESGNMASTVEQIIRDVVRVEVEKENGGYWANGRIDT